MVKNLLANAEDIGSIPGQGTKIPNTLEEPSQHTSTSECLCAAMKYHT